MAGVLSPSLEEGKSTTTSTSLRSGLRQPISSSRQQSRSLFVSSSNPGSASFRNEEDSIIVEFGSRWLRAGYEGDSSPMCAVGFGPEQSRRAGDYRDWLQGNLSDSPASQQQQSRDAEDWVRDYELWRMNLREVDLGLVEDKIERAFRDVYNKYLLTEAGKARLVLVLPSIMPHPLLSSVLSTLFGRWRIPSITLLPSPAMSTVAAGLRSALVVDIGWAETTATGIYEYREITSRRSTRAMKALQQAMGEFLSSLAVYRNDNSPSGGIVVPFQYCEEVVNRLAWCGQLGNSPNSSSDYSASLQEDSSSADSMSQKTVSIPSPSDLNSNYIDVPFFKFADPVERALLAKGTAYHDLDDDEEPIPLLIYNTLLALPPDARGTCMSRIIFTGGGSRIPGIRRRVLQEVSALFEKYGFSRTRGKVIDVECERRKLQSLHVSQQPQQDPQEEELDYVEQKLRKNKERSVPSVDRIFREVDSLGPWAGASLMVSLKTRGLVEIEREKYLQHGFIGISRDSDSHTHASDRRSGLRPGGDRSSWTLGGWG